MKIGKFTVAVAAVAALTLTACGSDDGDDAPKARDGGDKGTSAEATTEGSSGGGSGTGAAGPAGEYEDEMTNGDERPGIDALNAMLETALDPDIEPDDKVILVEGSDADPELFTLLTDALAKNPDVTYKLTPPVLGAGPNKATVKVEVGLPGSPPTKADATIVFDDGRWKLSKATVCPLLDLVGVESAMCPS